MWILSWNETLTYLYAMELFYEQMCSGLSLLKVKFQLLCRGALTVKVVKVRLAH